MKIYNISSNLQYKNNYVQNNKFDNVNYINKFSDFENISFTANKLTEMKNHLKYLWVKKYTNNLLKYISNNNLNPILRDLKIERLEGLQYGIKAFEGMSMKEIQYLCENLHVIAVKRGCKNMCGHCYADAKPQKREMSWEGYTTITNGFKEIRKRLHGLCIYGENNSVINDYPIYKVTELFYDADCMDLAIKDKNNKVYDFIDMLEEIHAMGRKSCFDTSGWLVQNPKMQARAEKYADYFSKPQNMDKLEAFNISFNVFSAHNVAAVKAIKNGDIAKANRLREKYTDKIANAIFTFTPLLEAPNFDFLIRSFGPEVKNAKGFDVKTMIDLICKVQAKVKKLYEQDMKTQQKYVKSQKDIDKYMSVISEKMNAINVEELNSSGRMKQLLETFNIKAPLQNHSETTPIFIEDLKQSGRRHQIIAHKLIDTDGKVYHMDYARFFPTEIQLNIEDKSPAPKLANLQDFVVTKSIINR